MPAPFLTSRKQIALALEAVTGVGETLENGDVIGPIWDASYTPTVNKSSRTPVAPSYSPYPQVMTDRMGTISFKTEWKGGASAGAAPAHLSKVLQACAMSETIVGGTSVTYKAATASQQSCTIELLIGDATTNFKVHRLVGAMGDFTMDCKCDDIIVLTFTFTGVYSTPTDSTALTSLTVSLSPPPFLSTALNFQSLGAGNLRVSEFSFALGNKITLRKDCSTASGYLACAVTGRTSTGKIDPETELVATHDFYTRWTAGTLGTLSFVVGTGAGNIATFTFLNAQIITLSPGDRDGIETCSLDLQFNRNAAAGDDEISFALT